LSLANRFKKSPVPMVPGSHCWRSAVKNWIDNAIPFTIMVMVVAVIGMLLPNFFSGSNISIMSRQYGELALVVLAMTTVILVGGIDLSVGSNFALGNFMMFYFLNLAEYSVGVSTVLVVLVCGLVNGLLVVTCGCRHF